ncbi:hypothetical protein JCM10213v2_002270 [Rhodosporidiobolus nylandii]
MSDKRLTLTAEEEAWEKEWVKQFNIANDTLDASSWERFFLPNATSRYGNNPERHGWPEIRDAFTRVLSFLSWMDHNTFVPSEGVTYHTCIISYKVKGDESGEQFDIPALGVITKELGSQEWRMSRFQLYNDLSPVLLRVREVMTKQAAATAAAKE